MSAEINIPAFSEYSNAFLKNALSMSVQRYHWNRYERSCGVDETLYSEGKTSTCVVLITHGTVALYRQQHAKHNLMISVCCDGDVLGLESLYGRSTYSCTAVAKKESRILEIPLAEFRSALEADKDVMYAILREYGNQTRLLDRRFVGVARMSSRARLCDLLLLIESRVGVDENGNVNATLRGRDLAELAASAEETIYRIVAKLESDRLLQYKRGKVRLLDKPRLATESSKFSS